MKTLSLLSLVHEVGSLLEVGAEEIYCGVMAEEVIRKYDLSIINGCPKVCNLQNFAELERVVQTVHSHTVPVFITFNPALYNDSQFALAEELIGEVYELL
ncbi:MAG: hypothetical protein KAX49_09830 [Halanaerobiales bacterium]|nr:hypothetical protein [Halanaerobiales bacterium]